MNFFKISVLSHWQYFTLRVFYSKDMITRTEHARSYMSSNYTVQHHIILNILCISSHESCHSNNWQSQKCTTWQKIAPMQKFIKVILSHYLLFLYTYLYIGINYLFKHIFILSSMLFLKNHKNYCHKMCETLALIFTLFCSYNHIKVIHHAICHYTLSHHSLAQKCPKP